MYRPLSRDSIVKIGLQQRSRALAGIEAKDWRASYEWTKVWISSGGGGWVPDAWLVYAVSGLLHRQPRTATHSLDMGIKTWLTGPVDRSVLTWCRGLIVMNVLNDPKTALLDLDDALPLLPAWLVDDAEETVGLCRKAAAVSRKRKPTVDPRPAYAGPTDQVDLSVFAPDVAERSDGDKPEVWETVVPFFRAVEQ